MPIRIRKVLLTLCRVQPPTLGTDTRFYQRHLDILLEPIDVYPTALFGSDSYRLPLHAFLIHNHTFFSTPVMCGFTSMLVRYTPYGDTDSVIQVREDTLFKELEAATTTYHPISMDYTCIFSSNPRDRDIPLYHSVCNPETASELYQGLRDARAQVASSILIPKVSKKTIPTDHPGYSPFEDCLRQPRTIQNLSDVEEVYFRTGIRLWGRTELRSAWKGNDLKPRVYYARGATVHFASSVIQRLFNVFVDSIPNVHRRNRFMFADLEMMTPDQTMFIYDYSSFTSTLHEIRNFTAKLADFCRHHTVTVLDGHLGLVQVDLGDLLDEYNQVCNIEAEFDASQLLSTPDAIFEHNCGMLGVPGNISSCTLLHGIHLAILIGSLRRCKTIGDDAFGFTQLQASMTKEILLECLQSIGRIALDKMEFWEDHESEARFRWNYEKRSFERHHELAFKGALLTWPSINVLANIINPEHRPLRYSPAKTFKVACSQLVRFQTQLYPLDLSQLEKDLILDVLRTFYVTHELRCGEFGFLGELPIYGEVVQVLIPPCGPNFFRLSMKDIMRSHIGAWLWLPPSDSVMETAYTLEIGSGFHAMQDGFLSYMCAVDVLEKRRLQERVLLDRVPETVLDQYLQGSIRFPYSFTIVDRIPDWCVPFFVPYLDPEAS